MNVKKILLYLLLLCLCNTGCKNSHSQNNKNNGQQKPLNGEWYKHYTGAIAEQPVVLNLHHYAGITTGSYYYVNTGRIIDLTESGDVVDNFGMHFSEFERTNRDADAENYKPAHWSVNFNDKEINGKWTSSDNTKTNAIDLKEGYPPGCYPLNILIHADSTGVKKGITNTEAVSSYELLQPTPQMKTADIDFFNKTILHFLGADTQDVKNDGEYMIKEDKKYFHDYKRLLQDMKIDHDANDDWRYNFYHSRNLWVLYNDNSILSLQLHQYDYSAGGSGHGTYWSTYACVDIQQKKVWELNDMVNTAKLLPILNQEVRSIFKLAPKDTLANTLKSNTLPLTENVFITGSGITFCYYPGEIASDAYGEISLFIPYTRLTDMLKDDFKKRIGL